MFLLLLKSSDVNGGLVCGHTIMIFIGLDIIVPYSIVWTTKDVRGLN